MSKMARQHKEGMGVRSFWGHGAFLVGGLFLVLAGWAATPILTALSSDGHLAEATLLSLAYLRIFFTGLGLAACLWPWLAAPRLRLPLLLLVLGLALTARAVRLDAPYLDHHAHRQTDVATIARNFYEDNPSIFWPQVNWRADAPNYIESQFPLVPWLASRVYQLTGEQPWVGRGIVTLFAGLQVVALYGLVSLYWGQVVGFLAALFVAVSPLAVYFGRAFMDDTPSLALATAALWGVAAWARRGRWWMLTLGLFALALAVMVKLVTLYIFLPVVVILWQRWGWHAWRRPAAWGILVLPLLPVVGWYAWARMLGQQYLTFGIWGPASNEAAGLSKWGSADLVFSQAFVRRLGGRILNQVLTPVGLLALATTVLAVAFSGRRSAGPRASELQSIADREAQAKDSSGAFSRDAVGSGAWATRGLGVFGAWLAGVLVYVGVSGQAQYIHDYYQLPFVAVLAPFVGYGLTVLWRARRYGRWLALGLAGLLALFSARVLPEYHLDWHGWILREVQVVQAITEPDDPIITVTFDNQPTLLYHLHRPGWIVDYLQPDKLATVPDLIAAGGRLVILQNIETPQAAAIRLTEQPWLAGLTLVEQTDRYAIYQVPVTREGP